MKTRLTFFAMAAIFLSACAPGAYVTDRYSDDIYFDPGSIPPPIAVEDASVEAEPAEKPANSVVISEVQQREDGSEIVNNYIFEKTGQESDALFYGMDQSSLYASDTTTYYNEDEVKYVINNYYDGDALDYAYRIRRFHRPYFYDSFYWDSWYYDPFFYDPYGYAYGYTPYRPYWSWGWGHSWYGSYYGMGWGSPYSYWDYPYSYGYYGGYPYYSGYYGRYPYSGWHGGSHWYADSGNRDYGQRRSDNTSVIRSGDESRRSTGTAVRPASASGRTTPETAARSGQTSVNRGTQPSSAVRTSNVRTIDGSDRTSIDRGVAAERRRTDAVQSNSGQAARSSSSQTSVGSRIGSTSVTKTYTRPATHTTISPRVVPQPRSTGSPNTVTPGSVSAYNRTYRTTSTYNRSSSNSSVTRTYTAPGSSVTKSGSTYQRVVTPSSSSRSSTPSSGSSGSYRSSGSSSSSSGSYSPSGSGSSRSSSPSSSSSSSSSSSGRRR